jgi:hypothetical protein
MFKNNKNLLGQAGDSSIRLDQGEHVYPFEFRMPLTSLPASFKGNYGKIEYSVTAVFLRPGYPKQTLTTLLTVPSTRNETESSLQHATTVSKKGYSGWFLWKTGHYDITASIPKKGFASG